MIVTDGINEVEFKKEMLVEDEKGIIIKPLYDYWSTELLIERNKKKYKRILKQFPDGGDVVKIYKIIKNSNNKIFLTKDDYKEINLIYQNMQLDDSKRENAIIKSVSELFAYECYQNYFLEDTVEKDPNVVYLGLEFALAEYVRYKYKKEVWKRTKDILKQDYKINLDKILNEGMKQWKI